MGKAASVVIGGRMGMASPLFIYTGVGVFQCLPLVGWCVAHAVFPSYRPRRILSVIQSIDLCKVTLKIKCLKAFTRVRQRLKHLNQMRRKGKVVELAG